jgi:hypothetical protein
VTFASANSGHACDFDRRGSIRTIDDGCPKVYITDKASGGEVEAYYDPATGELVQAKLGKKLN